MKISATFKFVSLVLMSVAILSPALVNAAPTSSLDQEADSLHSAYQIAVEPRTIFVRNIDSVQALADTNADINSLEIRAGILNAIFARLRIELSLLPASAGELAALKRLGSWSEKTSASGCSD